jgi:hypothetical protein
MFYTLSWEKAIWYTGQALERKNLRESLDVSRNAINNLHDPSQQETLASSNYFEEVFSAIGSKSGPYQGCCLHDTYVADVFVDLT